jgi:hypothetical protein
MNDTIHTSNIELRIYPRSHLWKIQPNFVTIEILQYLIHLKAFLLIRHFVAIVFFFRNPRFALTGCFMGYD